MPYVHRLLHLQPHHHTGRLLQHRHTSYRSLALLLGLAGLVMLGLNHMAQVTADSLYVTAKNPAPIPTTAATIDVPSDNYTTTTASLTVRGTCPVITPLVIVTIVDNGQAVGSAACDSSYAYSLSIILPAGTQHLVPRTTTITGDDGPDGAALSVTYQPPPSSAPPSSAPAEPTPPAAPTGLPTSIGTIDSSGGTLTSSLTLVSSQPFIVFGPAKDAVWLGSVSGGKPPYHMVVSWGDGSNSQFVLASAGPQTLHHHYSQMRAYDIAIVVHDSNSWAMQHVAAVTPYVAPATISGTPSQPLGKSRLIDLYVCYLLLLMVFGALWIQARPFAFAHAHGGTPKHPSAATRRPAKQRRQVCRRASRAY